TDRRDASSRVAAARPALWSAATATKAGEDLQNASATKCPRFQHGWPARVEAKRGQPWRFVLELVDQATLSTPACFVAHARICRCCPKLIAPQPRRQEHKSGGNAPKSCFLETVADAVERLDHVEVVIGRLELLAQPLDVAVDGAVVDVHLI